MKKVRLLAGLLLIGTLNGLCLADAGSVPSKENDAINARIEKLEKELAELKKIVTEQKKPEKAEAPAKAAEKPAPPAPEKKPVVSGLDVKLYGRLKLDAAIGTSRADTGDFVKWIRPNRGNNEHSQFDLTANESRLGLWVFGPKDNQLQTSGRVEIDFFGGGAENKSNPMLRHAYLNLNWPQDKFSILAGQTSDVISPLFPYTLNYSVAWWAGNIGYRRPQIRLTKICSLDDETELKLEGALARTIGRINSSIMTADQTDSGENSGIPSFQGRVGLTFPWLAYKPTTIGFSGHYGREKYDTPVVAGGPATGSKTFDSWSLNLDVTQPISKCLTIKGEIYWGKDLDAYLGGIGQGVNTAMSKEIHDKGGWVAAELKPCDKWSFNLGYTMDDADRNDLVGMTGDKRTYNSSLFGNVIYSLDENAQIGFELSHWKTDYLGANDAESVRAQTSFIYNF